jgi:hypothetical protein
MVTKELLKEITELLYGQEKLDLKDYFYTQLKRLTMKDNYKYTFEDQFPEDRMIKLYKDHAGINISTDISDFENVDCHIYSESTADGYDVFICTNDVRQPSICEDVYYYDNDLADAFEDQIRYGDKTYLI